MRNEGGIANFWEQLKSPDVPETPNIPGIIVDNTSGWGPNAPREDRPITGYVVDDHEKGYGVDDGLGSLGAEMGIGGGKDLVLKYLYRAMM